VSAEKNHTSETRMLIFGLSRHVTVQEVQALLGRCRQASVQLLVQPGDNDEAVGLVHLPPGRTLACRLSDQLNQRSLRGRRLHAWVPVMAWS
jgi:predicted carbohydrate-binding protein with CBM5 and CBM33 domain